MGATKDPEEAVFPIRHCLLKELNGSGRFYACDALCSPLDATRDPGTAAYNPDE
jgi:hypothetical protein